MKNLTILFCLLIALSSCRKDPCKDMNCRNGGTCYDGSCSCPDGYSGTECENYDPCYNVICKNGGSCNNGTCSCPNGYTGSDCGTEKTPTSMTITKIVVTKFPSTDPNGGGWDLSDGPDIYVTLNTGSSANNNDFKTGYYEDADNSYSYDWDSNDGLPVILSPSSSTFTIGLWDWNTISDEFMGGFNFIPNNSKSGFPQSIQLGDASNNYNFTIYVTWNF